VHTGFTRRESKMTSENDMSTRGRAINAHGRRAIYYVLQREIAHLPSLPLGGDEIGAMPSRSQQFIHHLGEDRRGHRFAPDSVLGARYRHKNDKAGAFGRGKTNERSHGIIGEYRSVLEISAVPDLPAT
jgi:hypothetical protein